MDLKTCPSPDQLTAFVLGTLDDPQITAIAEHLDLCSTCEHAVAGLEDLTDSVVEGLRRRSGEFPAQALEPELPEILGDYRLIRVLGRGGMGVVYEAEQIALGRRVALKVLPQQARLDPRLLSRFRREAQAAARLHHTHIVPVFGVGEADGVPFYVMQLIHGRGLDSVLRARRSARKVGRDETVTHVATSDCLGEGRAYWKSVARLGLQVAEALEHAHGEGFLHRDIKPSNLLIDDRASVWVTDFGLVKELAEAADLTHSGAFLGTLRYAPPEALQGQKADARGDLYSLGITLYELATLRPAFEDNDRSRLMHRILHEDPMAPRQIEPALPRDLETIILKTCSREPSRRYQTAVELAADLQRFLDDQPIRARPLGQWGHAVRWAKRNPAIAGLITTLMMVLTFGFVIVSALWLKADAASRHAESRRVEAVQSLERAEANVYYSRISQADLNYQLGNILNSRLDLEQAEPHEGEVDRRDWEWSYLASRLNAEIATFPGHHTWIFGLAPLSDGRLVVGGGEPHFLNADEATPGDLRVWNLADGTPVATLQVPGFFSVSALAVSPDERFLLTHDAGGVPNRTSSLRLWDLRAGTVVWRRPDLNTLGGDGTFSPDGRVLLARDRDRTHLLDAATGATVRTFPLARSARFVEADRHLRIALLAPGSEAGLWDPDTGKAVQGPSRLPFPDAVEQACFSADGRWLAVLIHDDTMTVWDVATGRKQLSLDDPGDSPSSCAFRPDGRALAIGYRNGRVRVIDLFDSRGNEVYKGHHTPIQALAFGPDGSTLASGDWSGNVKVWDMTRPPDTLSYFGARRGLSASQSYSKIEDFAFVPNSNRLVAFRLPMGELAEWHADSGLLARRRRIDVTSEGDVPGRVGAISEDGRVCVASETFANELRLFDAATGERTATLTGMRSPLNRLEISRDGSRVTAIGLRGRPLTRASTEVVVWDATGDAPSWQKVIDGEVGGGLAISPDGTRVAVSTLVGRPDDRTRPFPLCRIRVYQAATGQLIRSREFPWQGPAEPMCPLVFDPDGQGLAFVVITDGSVRVGVWDLASGSDRFLSRTNEWFEALAFSPDGRRLASASHPLVTLWDTTTGRSILSLPILEVNPGAAYNTRLKFSPDGKTLAASHSHGQLVTWRADDGTVADRYRAASMRRFGWHLGLAFASSAPEHAGSLAFHLRGLERQRLPGTLALGELAMLDQHLGRYEAADAKLKILAKRLHDDPQIWLEYGWLSLDRGQRARAYHSLETAFRIWPKLDVQSLFRLSMLGLADGIDRPAKDVAAGLRAASLSRGNHRDRLESLQVALTSPGRDKDPADLLVRGQAILNTVTRSHPGYREMLEALMQLRAGKASDAETLARAALGRSPTAAYTPILHATLALALRDKGKLPDARAELAKADAAHDAYHPASPSTVHDPGAWLMSLALRREARQLLK